MTRLERYTVRLDDYLAQLPSEWARRNCLHGQREKFEREYERFQALVDGGVYDGDATAWDYQETLAELDRRIAAIGEAVAA